MTLQPPPRGDQAPATEPRAHAPWWCGGARHVLFLGLSLLFASRFFPLANPTTHAITTGDPALMCWTLQWVSHALVHDPWHLFQGNAFYPYSHAVILTDAMVSLAAINVPIRALTDNPWVGYNLLIVLAYYLSCLSGAWLAEEVTGSRAAGLWGGIFWGFLFFRVHHIGHLQILSFQGIPAAIVCLVRWWKQPGLRTALLFSLVFVAQALVSWYLAVILAVTLAVIALARPVAARWTARHVSYGAVALLLTVGAILPFAWPYTRVFDESSVAARRELVNTFGDAVRAADYLVPPSATIIGHQVPKNPYWIWQENTLYIGYVALALAAFGLASGRRPGPSRRWIVAGVLLVVVGYVFALGFVSARLGARLPLHFVAQAVPFVAGMRATQRFSLVLYAGILILSALGLHALSVRVSRPRLRPALVAILTTLFLIEVFPFYLPFGAAAAWSPSVLDRAIARYQGQRPAPLVVLHLPIYYFVERYPISESRYMLDSTAHWGRLVNGFSGGEPVGFMERMRVLDRLPDEAAVGELRRLGVDVVAVHAADDPGRRERLAAYFRAQPFATVVPMPGHEFLVLLTH